MCDSAAAVDVVIVASCNIDLISYIDRMPLLGETLNGNEFSMGFGGKGANKCIAMSRLGSKCAIICKLGDDLFGKNYLQNLKDNNINTDYVFFTNKASTGVAPIMVDTNGNNSIIVILGANLHLMSDDIQKCDNLIKNAKILVTNLEIPIETALYSLKLAKANNLLTILNFAPARENVNENFFEHTDILILNEVEAEFLSGVSIKTVEDARNASKAILKRYNGISIGIAITLGEKGVLWASKSDESNAFHVPCVEVKLVVDTSGAGDGFVGSFAHFLSKLSIKEIKRVIELANAYAALTVQSKGTQTSYPYLNIIDASFNI